MGQDPSNRRTDTCVNTQSSQQKQISFTAMHAREGTDMRAYLVYLTISKKTVNPILAGKQSIMNVLLPQPIEIDAVRLLKDDGCNVTVARDPHPDTVLPLMADAHAMILRTGIRITRELLASAPHLLVIARTGGGIDNIDLNAATDHEIIVTSNLGVNTISVTEHVLALMLSLTKRLPTMDRAVRNDDFAIRYKNLPRDLHGKTIGLVGFGRIGLQVAHACKQLFDMQVMAFDPYLPDHLKEPLNAWVTFCKLAELLENADVVSIHVPLNRETRHLIGANEFGRMKAEAILINTSRGGVVDEDALAEALSNQTIAAAGLDVFSSEPVPSGHPLLDKANVILTPHSAALTRECVIRMATEAARCVLDVFQGRKPANVANPEALRQQKFIHLQ